MPTTENAALSTVEASHQARTGGDVDRALSYVSDDVRCFAPDENVTTKSDWHHYLTSFVPMLTGAPEHAVRGGQIVEIHLAFDRLGYVPQPQPQPPA